MFSLVLVVLALADFGTSISLDDCPKGITRDKYLQVFQDSCFEFVVYRKREYNAALQECKLNGGLLALVKTPEIQNFIYDQMINTYNKKDPVWIGLNDKGSENDWVWEDGESMKYENWADGQGPNYDAVSHLLEDCTVLDPGAGGKWHDYDCHNELFGWIKYENYFVCHYKIKAEASTAKPVVKSTMLSKMSTRYVEASACPPFNCELDCGLTGFIKNPSTGCSVCQCGN